MVGLGTSNKRHHEHIIKLVVSTSTRPFSLLARADEVIQ
jgi:hypothetical protein